jgi:hypothetical protein
VPDRHSPASYGTASASSSRSRWDRFFVWQLNEGSPARWKLKEAANWGGLQCRWLRPNDEFTPICELFEFIVRAEVPDKRVQLIAFLRGDVDQRSVLNLYKGVSQYPPEAEEWPLQKEASNSFVGRRMAYPSLDIGVTCVRFGFPKSSALWVLQLYSTRVINLDRRSAPHRADRHFL